MHVMAVATLEDQLPLQLAAAADSQSINSHIYLFGGP